MKPEGELKCKSPDSGLQIPGFLQFELAGGWGAGRNFAFGKQENGGAFDPLIPAAYATMGLGALIAPTDAARIDQSIGGPMVVGSSFLAGLNSVTTPEARSLEMSTMAEQQRLRSFLPTA